MANSSLKKREQLEIQVKQKYSLCIAFISLFHLFANLWQYSFSSVLFSVVFFAAVNVTTLWTIIEAIRQGTPYEYTQDMLFINWFVQITTLFSSWFFCVYLVVPVFAATKVWPFISQMLSRPVEHTLSPEEMGTLEKKRVKKERKRVQVRR